MDRGKEGWKMLFLCMIGRNNYFPQKFPKNWASIRFSNISTSVSVPSTLSISLLFSRSWRNESQ